MSIEKCMVCHETVNPDELLSLDGASYHSTCFKCSQCNENLTDDNYSSLDGVLYCKPHFDKILKQNRRLPRKLSLPQPSELRKTSSRLSSRFFRTQAKRAISEKCTLPSSRKTGARDIVSEVNGEGDDASTSNSHTTSSQSLPSTGGQLDPNVITNQTVASKLDLAPIINLLIQNPAGFSNQTNIGSPDFLKNMLDQITQNPEIMNAIIQLGQQMDGNQDPGGMFAAMSDGGDLNMPYVVQQMMPLISQALHRGGSYSNLLEHNKPKKQDLHRRCYSDSSSISNLPMDCQMSLKEAAQKVEEEHPAVEVFAAMVEAAALLHENVHDIYGLADLCIEEELAEEFIEMLKHDVCRRLGKRYDRCKTIA